MSNVLCDSMLIGYTHFTSKKNDELYLMFAISKMDEAKGVGFRPIDKLWISKAVFETLKPEMIGHPISCEKTLAGEIKSVKVDD